MSMGRHHILFLVTWAEILYSRHEVQQWRRILQLVLGVKPVTKKKTMATQKDKKAAIANFHEKTSPRLMNLHTIGVLFSHRPCRTVLTFFFEGLTVLTCKRSWAAITE